MREVFTDECGARLHLHLGDAKAILDFVSGMELANPQLDKHRDCDVWNLSSHVFELYRATTEQIKLELDAGVFVLQRSLWEACVRLAWTSLVAKDEQLVLWREGGKLGRKPAGPKHDVALTQVDDTLREKYGYPKGYLFALDKRFDAFRNDFAHAGYQVVSRQGAGGNCFTCEDLIVALRHARSAALAAADFHCIYFGPSIADKHRILQFFLSPP